MNLLDISKNKGGKFGFRLIATVLVWGWFLVATAMAESPSVVNVSVGTTGNYVTMDAALLNGFTEEIREAVESGVPMTMTFNIELRKEVSLWADSLVRANTVSHTVQYDSLKKAYRFSEVGKNVKRSIITRKPHQYQKLMLSLKNIPLAPIYQLDPKEKYYVRVKADLEMDRFWFPFNYLLFFVPFNDFETSWAKTSPLTLDQDLVPSTEAFNAKSKGGTAKGLNHVIRSFNK